MVNSKIKYSAFHIFTVILTFILLFAFTGCQSEIITEEKKSENETLPLSPPEVDPEWSQWIKNNAVALDGAMENDSFEDLYFLKDLLEGRRIGRKICGHKRP